MPLPRWHILQVRDINILWTSGWKIKKQWEMGKLKVDKAVAKS